MTDEQQEAKVISLVDRLEQLAPTPEVPLKEENAKNYNPREVLEDILTSMDAGEIDPKKMIIIFTEGVDGTDHQQSLNYRAGGVDRADFLAILTKLRELLVNTYFTY